MANSHSITTHTQSQLEDWLKQEREGVKFPVPFDEAWKIAGYSKKSNAKRNLPKSAQGEFYLIREQKSGGRGRPKEIINLSCDGLKHLCLMADTEEGELIRQYFIEVEKKWRLLQQMRPEVAEEIELQKLRNEGLSIEERKAKAEAEKVQAELALTEFRHTITQVCPEYVQQKILGYDTVEKVEYRDRVLTEDQMLRDGETVNKTELCHRYGFVTKTGNPDYKRLNKVLTSMSLPDSAFEETYAIRENKELKREYLPNLDRLFLEANQRHLFLGE